jgi:hypothetical protein
MYGPLPLPPAAVSEFGSDGKGRTALVNGRLEEDVVGVLSSDGQADGTGANTTGWAPWGLSTCSGTLATHSMPLRP